MNSKVLVIDDSGLVRKHMRRILNGAGYNVVEAHDGIAALETYFSEKPDVVLLDLVMGGMYGLDVLKKLRELDANARVVVASADIQTPSRDLARDLGALAFLNKPADDADVLGAVAAALEGGRRWN
jgi:two-component system, chemotaxis family, chemotaxis protein CheY